MQGLNEPYKVAIEKKVIILASPKPGLRIIHAITTSIALISCRWLASVCLLLAVCKNTVIKVPWTEHHVQGGLHAGLQNVSAAISALHSSAQT